MANDEPRVFLTAEQALTTLPDGDRVHTFKNPAPSVLVGADWDRPDVEAAIRAADKIEIAGPMARGMGHGLVLYHRAGLTYVATDESRLSVVEVTP